MENFDSQRDTSHNYERRHQTASNLAMELLKKISLVTFLCILTLNNPRLCEAKGESKYLTEENWEEMLKGEWMVEFYAPWCPACRALEPVWNDFASWSEDLGIKVGQVDVTEAPGLSGRFMVTALPTLYHVKDGVFRQYRGSRDKDEFMSFIEEKKWQSVDPIPSWKAPSSVQMSIVSGFFKLTVIMRNIHTELTENRGLPVWASYLAFCVATVVLGAVLGVIIVFIMDCIWPPRPRTATSSTAKPKSDDTKEDKSQQSSSNEEENENEEKVDEQTNSSPDVRRRRARKAE